MTLQHAFLRCSTAHHPPRPWLNPGHPLVNPCSELEGNLFCALCRPLVKHCSVTGADSRSKSSQVSRGGWVHACVCVCAYVYLRPEKYPHHSEYNGERLLQD